MPDITTVLPDKAGWVVAGALATKLVDWLLSFRKNEGDRVTRTYDAINAAQKQLVDGLFQQVAQLRTELNAVHQHASETAAAAAIEARVAQDTIRELETKVHLLEARLSALN